MNFFPFNEPHFWELIAIIIVLIFSLPFVYIAYIIVCLLGNFSTEKITLWKRPRFTIHDPVFGEIKFNPLFNAWMGFAGADSLLNVDEIVIEADEIGPSEAQRTLYQEIRRRFPGLESEMLSALRKELHQFVRESNLEPEFNLPEKDWDFSTFGLYLPMQIEPATWELSCSTALDNYNSSICTVMTTDWKIKEIEIEFVH